MNNKEYLAKNAESVKAKINQICIDTSRDPEKISLIWVSKNHTKEAVETALELGAYHFGENRVQEALTKFDTELSKDYQRHEVHIIGPLQSNKIRKSVKVADWIHTVSSLKHLLKINEVAEEFNKKISVLFQVNASGESSKSGLSLGELPAFLDSLTTLESVDFRGLMTIGVNTGQAEDSRVFFKEIKKIQEFYLSKGACFSAFNQLSMGMSGDLEVAIEEGSTMLRIGTALFGKRDYSQRGY
jgi:pyridoxal phosphate enzyme (YggS family)